MPVPCCAANGTQRLAQHLFQQIVNDLDRGMALFNGVQPLVYLTVGQQGRAERGSIRADFTLRFQFFQRGERIVARQRVHAGIVQLVQINAIRFQAAQTCLAGFANIRGRPVVRALALPRLQARTWYKNHSRISWR